MAVKIDGGTILARLLLEDKPFLSGLKKAIGAVVGFAAKLNVPILAISEKIAGVGQKMAEMGEKFTFLAAATITPMVMAMKSFADKSAEARDKIAALQEEYSKLKPTEFMKKSQIAQEIARLQWVQSETASAARTQDRLSFAFRALNYNIGKLLWETLGQYVPYLSGVVKSTIEWMRTNRELSQTIIKLIAGFGAAALVIAPIVSIGGRVIMVFSLLLKLLAMFLSPLGLVVAAFAGLYLLFRDQLDPIIAVHVQEIQKLWTAWQSGSVTTQDAIKKLGSAFLAFFNESLAAVMKRADEWSGGWIAWSNKLVEDGFYYIIRAFDKLTAATEAAWNSIVGKFDWAKGKLSDAFASIRQFWDDAVGNSWWTDSVAKMAGSSEVGMARTVSAFASGAVNIQRSMGSIRGALSGNMGRNWRALAGSSVNGLEFARSMNSTTVNITPTLSTQELQRSIARYTETKMKSAIHRVLKK